MAHSDSNKKILVVINNFDDISHNQHLLRLLNYLSQKNIIIYLYCFKESKFFKKDFYSIKNIKHLKKNQLFQFLKKNKNIKILTKELRSEYFVFLIKLINGWKNYQHYSIRPSFGFINNSAWKILKNILFHFSVKLVNLNIAVSKTVENRIKKIKSHSKTIYIANSIENTYIKNNQNFEKNFNFVYTGFLNQRKNVSYSVELLKNIKYDFKFDILGKGPEERYLKRLIKKNNLSKKINFLGQQKNIRNYLDQSSIFLFMSKMEGLSLSLLEAMSMQLICIVSDIPENRELIIDDKNGFLLPLNNSKKASKKLENILKNKNKFGTIRKEAKETILRNYTDQISFDKYYQLLK